MIQFIKDQLGGYNSIRIDCPNCGGSNCFTASKVDGQIVYNCYRVSCGFKGRIDYEVSIDELRNISSNTHSNFNVHIYIPSNMLVSNTFSVPEYFTSPLQNTSCYALLNRYNLIDFYSKHVDRIRYDPKQHRCVFILKHEGKVLGATGRSLSFGNIPRWLVYERLMDCPFIISRESNSTKQAIRECFSTAIIVEDAISVSVASAISSSIGLLGSNVSDGTIPYLLKYDRLFIALDDDATDKSLKLQKQLSYYKPTQIITLRKDLKYFSKDELENLEREYLL